MKILHETTHLIRDIIARWDIGGRSRRSRHRSHFRETRRSSVRTRPRTLYGLKCFSFVNTIYVYVHTTLLYRVTVYNIVYIYIIYMMCNIYVRSTRSKRFLPARDASPTRGAIILNNINNNHCTHDNSDYVVRVGKTLASTVPGTVKRFFVPPTADGIFFFLRKLRIKIFFTKMFPFNFFGFSID